jgi:hypothetical protein
MDTVTSGRSRRGRRQKETTVTRSVIHSWQKVFAIVLPLVAGIASVAPAEEAFNLRDPCRAEWGANLM